MDRISQFLFIVYRAMLLGWLDCKSRVLSDSESRILPPTECRLQIPAPRKRSIVALVIYLCLYDCLLHHGKPVVSCVHVKRVVFFGLLEKLRLRSKVVTFWLRKKLRVRSHIPGWGWRAFANYLLHVILFILGFKKISYQNFFRLSWNLVGFLHALIDKLLHIKHLPRLICRLV